MSDVTSTATAVTPSDNLELLKHRLAIRVAIIDKLLIAIVVAIIGFWLNKGLQTYKFGLDTRLEAQKNEQASELEKFRASNAKALGESQGTQARALEDLRKDHQKQLESLRNAHTAQIELFRASRAQQLEALRAVLSSRSDLSQRRVEAYRLVYEAGVNATVQLELMDGDNSPEALKFRRETVFAFVRIWRSNRLFLTDHAGDKVTDFLEGLQKTPLIPGATPSNAEFQKNVEHLLGRLRRDMNNDLERERSAMSEHGT